MNLKPCVCSGVATAFYEEGTLLGCTCFGISCSNNCHREIRFYAPTSEEARRRLKTVEMLWNAPRTVEEMEKFSQEFRATLQEEEK